MARSVPGSQSLGKMQSNRCHFLWEINLLSVFVFLFELSSSQGVGLGCKDEDNHDVDWYVNYKLPKLEKGYPGTHISEGKAYAYISSSKPGSWKLSSNSVTSKSSMLAKTLKTFFDNKEKSSYLFYNDEPPAGYNGTANGHLKGVVAFDGNTGFWLVHSIPKSFSVDEYEYPDNALSYGQSVLCVSFKISALNQICRQLLYCSPKIYESGLTDEVSPLLDDIAKTIFTKKPAFNRKPPFKRVVTLKSARKEIFMSFVKDGQFKDDVYSAVLAPGLQTSLATETWRRGSGTYLPPSCDGPYDVTDIDSIKMTLKNGTRNEVVSFSSKEDHSKWAVSLNSSSSSSSSQSWICIGDMNRMKSQESRGGGSVCFQTQTVGDAYRSLIAGSDECPDV